MISTGSAILVRTGRLVDPATMTAMDVDVEDIAHGLSQICRFGGQCTDFYSVAQHSVIVSMACSPDLAMCGLMHDASEAYLLDVPTPHHSLFARVLNMHYRVMQVIATVFEFEWPMPPELKAIDQMALETEMGDLMGDEGRKLATGSKLPMTICPVGPKEAKAMFLDRYAELQCRSQSTT